MIFLFQTITHVDLLVDQGALLVSMETCQTALNAVKILMCMTYASRENARYTAISSLSYGATKIQQVSLSCTELHYLFRFLQSPIKKCNDFRIVSFRSPRKVFKGKIPKDGYEIILINSMRSQISAVHNWSHYLSFLFF